MHLLKFCQQVRSPVGSIYLITVIEEGMWIRSLVGYEGTVDVCQIISHGSGVEVVDDVSFTARCSTFNFLSGTAFIERDDTLFPGLSFNRICLDDFQFSKVTLFLRNVEFYLHQFLFHVNDGIHEYSLAGSFIDRNPRTTERPACSSSHVGFNTYLLIFFFYEFEHLHPFRREIRNIILVISLHTIEWRDFYGSNASFGIFVEVPL